jgi:hypothetical protein
VTGGMFQGLSFPGKTNPGPRRQIVSAPAVVPLKPERGLDQQTRAHESHPTPSLGFVNEAVLGHCLALRHCLHFSFHGIT